MFQQSASSKYHSGGLWTNTCCSHPRKGESTIEAAHRRLKEEMGFDCDFEEDDKSCGGLEKSQKAIEGLIIKLDWKIEVDYYIFNKNLDYFIIDTLDKKRTF